MSSNNRLKTRKKSQCSDILKLKESEFNTFVWKPCHGKAAMCPRVPRCGRVSALLTCIILGILVDAARGCGVDRCWGDFQVASQTLAYDRKNSDMTEKDVECIGLRTYLKCLEDLHGCKGNIKFHSFKNMVRDQLNEQQCETGGPVYEGKYQTVLPPDELCTYRGTTDYKHCALFGDPHIRTFSNESQTCRVAGAWPLIDNEHLTVQVTNEPVSFSEGATATTKLTVLIQRNIDCASSQYIMYQASSDYLPSTFDDGQTKYGKSHSVKLTELDPGKHVEIILKYIDTKILIRLIGSHLTFSIRMPSELLNSTSNDPKLELCSKGCPKSEIIDIQRFLALRKKEISASSKHVNLTRQEALDQCRNSSANLVDFYLDACVFDLLTTGNETFKDSAIAAIQDVFNLFPNASKTMQNRTSLEVYDKMYNAGNSVRTISYLNVLTLVLVSSLTLTLREWAMCWS